MSLVVDAEEHPPHGVIGLDQAEGFPPLEDVEPTVVDDEEGLSPPKRTRRRRADAGQPRTTSTRGNTRLAKELAEPLVMLGTMLSMTAPLPGAVVATRADVTAAALVKMAETRPGMLNALKRISQVGPAGEILTTAFMVLIAFQVHSERIRPDSMMAQATGITPLWIELGGHMEQAQREQEEAAAAQGDQSFGGFGTVPPPPPVFDAPGMDENGMFHAPPMFTAGRGAAMRNG